MNTTHLLSPRLRQLVLAHACALLAVSLASAQQNTAADSVQLAQEAKALAKYDKNKNGKLDADELAAQHADEARDANASVQRSDSGDVVTMSPFTVDASDDKGYAATNTMAGTKLNSKLEDLAGSISVVTKQQLLDTASVDLNDIFQYEVGTEGTKQFTDPSNDGRGDYDNVSGNPTGANRMRGLSQANIMVNGFTASSSIPVDSYNLDAVEVARGANSTLAGLSDAGGSVNLIAGRANLTRETTNLLMRVDSYEGYRTSIDLNRPIFRNKFALRLSAVYQEIGYERKPSVDRTNRQQFGLTYRPFKTTTISGSFERFHEWAQRANAITPRDTISLWRSRGSPTYDLSTQTFTVNGVKGAPITTMTNNVPAGIALLGSSNVRNLQYIDNGVINFITPGGRPTNTPSAVVQFTQSAGDAALGPLYKVPASTNRSIYDYTSINLAASNYETNAATIAMINLEQGVFNTQRNRLDLRVGWRRENQENYRRMFISQQDGVPAVLEMDTNERLVDGRPNPFFLHPFIGGLAPQVFRKPVFNDNYSAQLAYQLDLTHEKGWRKWLGLHRASAYGELRDTITVPGTNNGLRSHDSIVDNADFLGAGFTTPTPTTNLNNSNGAVFYPLYYMGKTPGGGIEYANEGPSSPNGKYVASFFNAATATWNVSDPVTIKEVYFSQPTQKKQIRTEGGSLQSYLWDGRLIPTFGQRKDRVYTIDNLPTTLVNGFIDETNLHNYGINKKWKNGTTRTKGGVLKPFRGWSWLDRAANEGTGSGLSRYLAEAVRGSYFYYNHSNSFLPADTAYNLFIEELPNPTSLSEEYGVGLTMFNRFSLRLTHQDTIQFHTRANTGTIATRALGMDFHPGGQNLSFNLYDASTGWQQQLHPEYSLEQAQAAALLNMGYSLEFLLNANGKGFADASDAESKGWELEVQFNPTKYWTLKVTGNKQEAIDSNISLFIQKFVDMRMPTWTTVKAPDGTLWWTTTQGSNGTPRDYFIGNIQTPLNLAITTQGKKKPQTREYRFSMITNYQLAGLGGMVGDHVWLKNFTVGGAYSWASKGAIGYYAGIPDSDGVVRKLDGTRPIFDKPTGVLDLSLGYNTKLFNNRIRTRFQLNVKNVTEDGHLQPIAANPDGRTWNYRIVDPRQFVFTTTFDL